MGHRDDGSTPLERLQDHYDDVDLVCPKCGYEDDGGHWRAKTDGGRIQYSHVCPSCGDIRKRTFDLRS